LFFSSFLLAENDGLFKQIREAFDTTMKRIFLVDSGLAFNSPYPLVLRPQRGVDLFISFDFSGRTKDNVPPFKVRS
jgi:phospholipase A2